MGPCWWTCDQLRLPDNGRVQNVVTLDLLSRLHPAAEPERRTWWVHEPGTGMSMAPMPGVCVLPYWQLVGRLSSRLAHNLERDRAARGQRRRDMEGIGRLDADDIAWLHTAGTLAISTDSGLLAIRAVLDKLVNVQPGLVEIAEQWRAWLDHDSTHLLPGSRFELHIGALFNEDAVFERVLSYRVFDAARFFDTCQGATQAEHLRSDMTLLIDSVGHVPGVEDPDATHMVLLRRAVTYNRLGDFLSLVDVSDPAQAQLIVPAFSAAIADSPQRRVELLIDRAHVAASAAAADVRLLALREAIDAVHEIRSGGDADTATEQYRRLLDAYAGDFLEDNEFLEAWLRLLANVSYLYITKLDTPQAALELLLPRLQAFDAREDVSATRSDPQVAGPLSRVRANMDAAVAKLQERGATIPPGVGANLSTSDRSELDGQWTHSLPPWLPPSRVARAISPSALWPCSANATSPSTACAIPSGTSTGLGPSAIRANLSGQPRPCEASSRAAHRRRRWLCVPVADELRWRWGSPIAASDAPLTRWPPTRSSCRRQPPGNPPDRLWFRCHSLTPIWARRWPGRATLRVPWGNTSRRREQLNVWGTINSTSRC